MHQVVVYDGCDGEITCWNAEAEVSENRSALAGRVVTTSTRLMEAERSPF
jgi:hypothetical protein